MQKAALASPLVHKEWDESLLTAASTGFKPSLWRQLQSCLFEEALHGELSGSGGAAGAGSAAAALTAGAAAAA